MINQYHLEDFIENREQHEDYYTVMEEYSVFYDELFEKHKIQELEKVTYNFRDELIY